MSIRTQLIPFLDISHRHRICQQNNTIILSNIIWPEYNLASIRTLFFGPENVVCFSCLLHIFKRTSDQTLARNIYEP